MTARKEKNCVNTGVLQEGQTFPDYQASNKRQARGTMVLEMEKLSDEHSAWTGWLIRSPAQALCSWVCVRMIHTCLADGAEESWGEATSYNHDMPKRQREGEISVGFYFPS